MRARNDARGFSLIELMVAIAIGLLLMLVMTRLMAQQDSARAEIEKAGRQIEDGRYAVNLLHEDVQLAGYYGQIGAIATVPAALPNPCETGSTAAGLLAIGEALALPIQGYDSPTTVPAGLADCIEDEDHLDGTDVLVVRRTDAEADGVVPATTVDDRVYVQTTPIERIVGLGGSTAAATFTLLRKDAASPAELRRYVQRIYFVSPCHVPASGSTSCNADADGGRPIPTLKRVDFSEAGFTITPLVEGVENLQVEYGLDGNEDGAPDRYETAPDLAEWPDVVAVRVGLLSRAIQPSAGHVDDRSYVLGSTTIDGSGDAYKRQAYVVAIRAVNPSGRRE